MKEILYQGAESIIYQRNNFYVKDRIKKGYRLEELDNKIRKQRTRKEAKLLEKSFNLINVPKIIYLEEYKIQLEKIEGKKLSKELDNLKNKIEVCKKIGENIAKIHDNNIIHGDLTTSNMILKKDKVYFIDFGLGFESSRMEDKASDLRLIKQAIEAKHYKNSRLFLENIFEGYKISKNEKAVMKQLEKVEKRGRYKAKY